MADFLEGDPGETISRNIDVEMERMESNISKQGYSDGFLAGKEEGSLHCVINLALKGSYMNTLYKFLKSTMSFFAITYFLTFKKALGL
jgi:hypothetical protein